MNKTFLKLIILYFLSLQSCSGVSFQQNIKVNPLKTGFGKKVDSIVANKMNNYNIPGMAIGLVMNDSIIYAKGYGSKSIENTEQVSENSNFHTASISKLFTAQAVMMILAENDIPLDEKLVNIIPEIRYKDERVKDITIKMLLNHTSGLPDVSNYHWKNSNQSKTSLKDYVLNLKLKLDSQPGTNYAYSSLAYNILGYLVEKLSKTSFEDYVKTNILNTNEMYNSDFRYFKVPDAIKTAPHSKRLLTRNVYVRKNYPYTREHAPSSTLNSSADDLSKWMISFLKTLENNTSKTDFRKMIKPSFESFSHIGLGFQLSKIDSKSTVGHYGGDKGYRSYLLMIPEEKIGLVLLANCDYDEDFRQEIIHPIAKLMLKMNKPNSK